MRTPDTSPAGRPSAPDAVQLELVDELTRSGKFAATTLETLAWTSARFATFCEAHGVDPTPPTDTTVLAFLESQRPISWVYAKSQVVAIAGAQELAGLPRPRLPEVSMYLQALLRDADALAAQPKVAALTDTEVEGMVSQLAASSSGDGGDDPEILGRRAAAALARLGATSWHELSIARLLPVQSKRETEDDACCRLARAVLTAAARHGVRLSDLLDPRGIDGRMAGVGRRAGIRIRRPSDVHRLSPADFRALLAHCDPAHQRNVRDWTYLCVGISGALRHISLAHAAIEDFRAVPEGYVATIRYAKLPPGQVLVKEFLHLSEHPGSCTDLLCPACAIDRQLDICRRQGRRTGPLLATNYGKRWRPMTRQNGRRRILQAYADLNPEHRRRIATRSVRSTAASWAFREGMTIAEIAEYVTNHRDHSTCRLYVQVHAEHLPIRPLLT